jgi:hypothetical protein
MRAACPLNFRSTPYRKRANDPRRASIAISPTWVTAVIDSSRWRALPHRAQIAKLVDTATAGCATSVPGSTDSEIREHPFSTRHVSPKDHPNAVVSGGAVNATLQPLSWNVFVTGPL